MPEEVFETPQPTQPTEPKHLARGQSSFGRNWPKIILVAVLGLGFLAGSAYAGYYYGTQQVQQPEKPTPIVSQPTPSVEDETKDWKTYRNNEFNYTVKYPPDLEFKENNYGFGLKQTGGNITVRAVGAATGDKDESFDEYVRHAAPSEIQNYESIHSIEDIISTSGVRGYKVEWIVRSMRGDETYTSPNPFYYYPPLGEFKISLQPVKTIQINTEASTNDPTTTVAETVALADKIAKTFGYLTTTPESPVDEQTEDWETYRSEGYGFEFRYPQNFQITEGLGQYFLNQQPVIELKSESFNYLQNTIDAYFTVSVKSNAKAECEYIPRGVLDTLQNKEINGANFTMFSTSGAATGNTYSNTILHHLKNTTCYEVVTTIHEANDGSSPDDLSKINEQKAKLENQLDQILSIFKFLE